MINRGMRSSPVSQDNFLLIVVVQVILVSEISGPLALVRLLILHCLGLKLALLQGITESRANMSVPGRDVLDIPGAVLIELPIAPIDDDCDLNRAEHG